MERSTEIVYDFLTPWARINTVLKACQAILVNTDHAPVIGRTCATITEFLVSERGRELKKHWQANDVKPGAEDVDKVNPDGSVIMKLNGICGFYGADRCIIHLYLHMYLVNALTGLYGDSLAEMDSIVDRYYRP